VRAPRLVSVLTGTWQRPELLAACIENVRHQTYRPLEHVIVSDGPDPDTARVALAALDCADQADVLVRYVPLGRHWTSYLTNSRNAVPFMVANWIASGDYQVWLADDERMLVTDYIERMVAVLEGDGVDFVYPNVEVYYVWNEQHRFVIGSDPPREGQVTQALHKTELLDLDGGGFRIHVGSGSDWDQFDRWMKAGKRWTHVPETLFSHRIDG
jgi:glycosyltransferase involved in cell wall biosynthesis